MKKVKLRRGQATVIGTESLIKVDQRSRTPYAVNKLEVFYKPNFSS